MGFAVDVAAEQISKSQRSCLFVRIRIVFDMSCDGGSFVPALRRGLEQKIALPAFGAACLICKGDAARKQGQLREFGGNGMLIVRGGRDDTRIGKPDFLSCRIDDYAGQDAQSADGLQDGRQEMLLGIGAKDEVSALAEVGVDGGVEMRAIMRIGVGDKGKVGVFGQVDVAF